MATGNIKGGKRNYARPTSPSTSTATTSEGVQNVSITYTPSTLGPSATSYVFIATSATTGAITPITQTLTTSPTTIQFTGGATYTANIAGQNYNGVGSALSIPGFTIPEGYVLLGTYNSTETITLGNTVVKIAGYVIGAGGGGGGGGGGGTWLSARGGGGGGAGSGGVVGFKDFTVTGGTTVGITIGAAGNGGTRGFGQNNNAIGGNSGTAGNGGNLTKITYSGTDIATANGGSAGNGGNVSPNNNVSGNGGNGGGGGNAASNVAGAITVTGVAGGAGSSNDSATAGSPQSNNTNVNDIAITGLFPSNNLGSGGGGASSTNNNNTNTAATGYPGSGGFAQAGTSNNGTAGNFGAGGGGGGGGPMGNFYSTGSDSEPQGRGGNGGAGGTGRIILYTKS